MKTYRVLHPLKHYEQDSLITEDDLKYNEDIEVMVEQGHVVEDVVETPTFTGEEL